jgi:hypothetical protein
LRTYGCHKMLCHTFLGCTGQRPSLSAIRVPSMRAETCICGYHARAWVINPFAYRLWLHRASCCGASCQCPGRPSPLQGGQTTHRCMSKCGVLFALRETPGSRRHRGELWGVVKSAGRSALRSLRLKLSLQLKQPQLRSEKAHCVTSGNI